MNYEEFKTYLLTELHNLYGEAALITIGKAYRNNGRHLEGICIKQKSIDSSVGFAAYLDDLYSLYQRGMTPEKCVKTVYEEERSFEYTEEMKAFTGNFSDWRFVRGHVYPVLLSTKENQELLKSLVSTSMLDLSIVYTIRVNLKEWGNTDIKINEELLSYYGISREELHNQAVRNMEQDGYRFQSMEDVLKEMCPLELWEEEKEKEKGVKQPPMYVLTNRTKIYGAAGILNQKLLREFAGGRSFYILPSSLHETIFIPAELGSNSKALDYMVADINRTEVLKEDRLSNHSYYYDGEAGDIRMCA